MASLDMTEPAGGAVAKRVPGDIIATLDNPENSRKRQNPQDDKPLVGRGGRFFSRAILTAWSPGALAAMDVRWRSTGERVCREVSR